MFGICDQEGQHVLPNWRGRHQWLGSKRPKVWWGLVQPKEPLHSDLKDKEHQGTSHNSSQDPQTTKRQTGLPLAKSRCSNLVSTEFDSAATLQSAPHNHFLLWCHNATGCTPDASIINNWPFNKNEMKGDWIRAAIFVLLFVIGSLDQSGSVSSKGLHCDLLSDVAFKDAHLDTGQFRTCTLPGLPRFKFKKKYCIIIYHYDIAIFWILFTLYNKSWHGVAMHCYPPGPLWMPRNRWCVRIYGASRVSCNWIRDIRSNHIWNLPGPQPQPLPPRGAPIPGKGCHFCPKGYIIRVKSMYVCCIYMCTCI